MNKHRIDERRVEVSKLLLAALALIAASHYSGEAQAKSRKPSQATPAQATLPVQAFLDQVIQGNDAYKAAEQSRKAAAEYSYEAALALSPRLVADAMTQSDGKPSNFPIAGFSYKSIDATVYSAGVAKLFRNGVNAKLSYAVSETEWVGLATGAGGLTKWAEARPQIEASIPLWRNFWGRETVGTIEAGRLSAMAKSESQDAAAKGTLSEAESTYWRLALAREALKVSKDAVDRARSMSEWTTRRVKLALSDRSENLQSTAQLKSRELEYKIAEDAERAARLAFNSARGLNSDKVPETLDVLNADLVAKWETPSRTQVRPDIEAARLQAEAAEANAKVAAERIKPTFELYGMYALNTPHMNTQTEAIREAFNRERPTSQYGLRLNMPLDFSSIKQVQDAYSAEASASRTLIARKLFEQERDWTDVVARFQLAREKIKLFEELEVAQREKLEHERTRQKSGRSTIAEVIRFESDYEQTQFSRINALADVLNLNAQMKLYGVAYDSGAAAQQQN